VQNVIKAETRASQQTKVWASSHIKGRPITLVLHTTARIPFPLRSMDWCSCQRNCLLIMWQVRSQHAVWKGSAMYQNNLKVFGCS